MIFLLLPFAASFAFCIAAMSLKNAINAGVGPWRSVFVTNIMMLLTTLWFLFLPGKNDFMDALPSAMLAGFCLFVGQIFTFLSITRGDISVATPVMGTKIIFVALLGATLFGVALAPSIWLAVLLATAGITLLQFEPGARHRRVLLTATLAGLSALSFAMADTLTQHFASLYGVQSFLPSAFLTNAVLGFFLIPRFTRPLNEIPKHVLGHLFGGAFLLAFQSMLMSGAIAIYGRASEVNIVYSLRGLWSVLLVWLIGHWFGNAERKAGSSVFIFRLVGAFCTLGAIALVLFPK